MSKTNRNTATENVAPELTEKELQEALIKEHGGVSKAIRALAANPEYQKDGKADRGKIAKAVGKRYQHVRNVLTQEPKKG
jgi:hypothetical protein